MHFSSILSLALLTVAMAKPIDLHLSENSNGDHMLDVAGKHSHLATLSHEPNGDHEVHASKRSPFDLDLSENSDGSHTLTGHGGGSTKTHTVDAEHEEDGDHEVHASKRSPFDANLSENSDGGHTLTAHGDNSNSTHTATTEGGSHEDDKDDNEDDDGDDNEDDDEDEDEDEDDDDSDDSDDHEVEVSKRSPFDLNLSHNSEGGHTLTAHGDDSNTTHTATTTGPDGNVDANQRADNDEDDEDEDEDEDEDDDDHDHSVDVSQDPNGEHTVGVSGSEHHSGNHTVDATHSANGHDVDVSDTAKRSLTKRDFKGDILAVHNQWRKQHHVSALAWDDTLASYAAPNANACKFQHTVKGKYGENIAAGYANTQAAVRAWGNEQSQYNYAAGKFGENTGHFTQMVWKATQKVGCAQKACPNILKSGVTSTYVVCEYYPPGNVIGQFVQNVLAP